MTLANIGLPMLPAQGVLMIAALIPVILIEAAIVAKRQSITYANSFGGIAAANLVSTLAGVPLAWGLMLLIQCAGVLVGEPLLVNRDSPAVMAAYVILNAAWLAPDEEHMAWMLPIALAVMMMPSYFVSVCIEYMVCKRIWKPAEPKEIWNTLRIANGATYGMLILACLSLLMSR